MNDIEQVKADVRATLDWVELQYPLAMFPEPKPARHGSVDGCSARGVRHGIKLARLQLERQFAQREAPPSACDGCLDMIPKLVQMEIYKHSWQLTGGPQLGTGPSHWAKMIDNQRPGIHRHVTTLRAVCGVTFSYEVDSSD